ncbi:MAG: molybdenum cofactor biosynthesis protein B [Natronomonas sp.]|jgi:molybdenum cofactor biosynthesis protein B
MSEHDHDDDHGGGHGHDDTHQHSHLELEAVSFGVVTVSSSRTLETDEGGDRIQELIEADGQSVAVRELVGDDQAAIAATVEALVERDDVDAIVLTGGTGLSPEDVTVEAVRPLFDQEIPGFGELFRWLSYEDIGPRALLSRAFAGSKDGVAIFCLPGNKQAAAFGTEELILPTVAHVLGHAQGV